MTIQSSDAAQAGPRLVDADEAMTPSAGVVLLPFGDSFGLFHEARQDLAELNQTAGLMWQALAQGETPAKVAELLIGHGASQTEAAAYVDEALHHWLGGGWMVPADLVHAPAAAPSQHLMLTVLGIGFELAFFGAPPPAGVLDMLRPLQGGPQASRSFRICAWHGRFVLFADGAPRGVYEADQLAPALKAVLTEQLAAAVTDGFIAHGALVEAAGRRAFLSGSPGAGKSTLAVSLAQAGFACLSDDIVQVDRRGAMTGAAFAPALKSGAWPLLAATMPGLAALPVHRRADGQDVRYAPDVISSAPARPLDIFIALDRRADGAVALDSLSGLEAMSRLLKDAFASAGRVSAADIQALAQTFASAQCYTLRYADLAGAVERLRTLAHG